jgi:riboflavin biosynthesis pyrimidine reductase
MLLPDPRDDLTDHDLDEAYAWPGWPEARPWLRANMVSTADGSARSPGGLSEGISGAADKRVFGRLRAYADVVLAGAGTARAEGYRPAKVKAGTERARADAGQAPVPAIALVTRSLHLDLASPLFTEALVPTIVITTASSDAGRRADVAQVADVIVAGEDEIDLAAALAALHERGLVRVHSEGGPHLLGDLAAAGVLDELLLTVSPVLAGGSYADGTDIYRVLAGGPIAGAPQPWALHQVLEDGGSLFLSYRRPSPGASG